MVKIMEWLSKVIEQNHKNIVKKVIIWQNMQYDVAKINIT